MKVLITAGPTREYLDPVRFLSNDSSGLMGFELAKAFKNRGARVQLVSGPTNLRRPNGISLRSVISAQEMFSAVKKFFPKADVFISTAAVSDWRFQKTFSGKLKKKGKNRLTVSLEKNPDILAWAGEWRCRRAVGGEGGVSPFSTSPYEVKKGDTPPSPTPSPILVGFSLETGNVGREAAEKLRRKKLDLMIGNTVRSFGSANILPFWIEAGGVKRPMKKMTKRWLAAKICAWVFKKMKVRKNV